MREVFGLLGNNLLAIVPYMKLNLKEDFQFQIRLMNKIRCQSTYSKEGGEFRSQLS
jgi:hypothetical protein